MRVRRADVSLRDVTVARDRKRGYTVRVTSRTRSAWRILGDFEKVSELKTCPRTRRLTFACSQNLCGGCHTCWEGGADEKARIERLYLSPYVEEPLNLKVIKKVRTRTEKPLRVFRISRFLCSMWYMYIYIYEHYMSISHTAISGYGTLVSLYIYIYIYIYI